MGLPIQTQGGYSATVWAPPTHIPMLLMAGTNWLSPVGPGSTALSLIKPGSAVPLGCLQQF